jgi:signal peptidase I
MGTEQWQVRLRRYWKREIQPLLITAIVLFAVRSSLADWNDVPTGSMKPTILEGDRVFVNKLAYDLKVPFTTRHVAEWASPERGEIVVFYSPHDGTRLIKRVIGVPGDEIELREERLYVNGQPMEYGELNAEISDQLSGFEAQQSHFAAEGLPGHPHAVMVTPTLPAKRTFGPVRVGEGQYFMMGDNRDNSFDSRYFGCVDRKRIVGRATTVVVSLNKDKYWLPRPKRWLRPLDNGTK